MVRPVGVEPTSTVLQTVAMTSSAKDAYIFGGRTGNRTPECRFGGCGFTTKLNSRDILAPKVGIEPTYRSRRITTR